MEANSDSLDIAVAPLLSAAIPYQVQSASAPSAAARTLVLSDPAGQVQLLTAADRFLDLDQLNRETGRSFQATGDADAEAICQRLGVSQLPGIPHLTGLPMLVDADLLAAGRVCLPAGEAGQWVVLEHDAATQLAADCPRVTCSAPAQLAVTDDGTNDTIVAAVDQFTSLRIQQRLDETLQIPPLPETARRIIELQLDPNYDLTALTSVVESDSSLAAQIVGWANSPFYNARGTIESIDDAIMRVLGFDMVVNLAVGLAVGQALKVPDGKNGGVFRYWLQSVYTAAAAEALTRCVPAPNRPVVGMTYLAGLLHNYGHLILAHVFPPHFDTITRASAANKHLPDFVIDQHVLGITRPQMAGALLETWMLPESVCAGVRYQHAPELAGEHEPYAQVIALSGQLLAGQNPWEEDEAVAESFAKLQIDRETAGEAMDVIRDSAEDLEAIALTMAG